MAKKKDDDYWVNRRAQMMYEQMELAEDAADSIRKQYLKVAKYIDKKLNDNFDRVVNRLGISDKTIREIIEKAGSTSYQDILRVARNKGLTELVEYLEQPGRKFRYERLINQLEETNNAIDSLKTTGQAQTTKALGRIAESTYYKSIYDVQSYTGLAFSFSEWDSKLFEKLAQSKWSGENYSKRIWNNVDDLAETLKSEFIQGFIAGKTQNEMYKVVMDRFGAGAFDAKRLVRTEGCYIANEMQMQAYTECGVEKYRFIATLDLRTSNTCAKLDGKIFNVKDGVPGVNMPPMHPFCRSTTIQSVNEETLTRMQRRARNPVTGKNELLPAGTTYEEWYKKYVEKKSNSDIIKEIKIPESLKQAKGMNSNIEKAIEKGVNDIVKDYNIEISEMIVEPLEQKYDNTPYLVRYVDDNGKNKSKFVVNSNFDFSGFEEVVSEGYKQNYFAGKTIEDHIAHEMAHIMTGQQCTTATEFVTFCDDITKNCFVEGVSGYSDVMQDGFETIAEAFVRIRNGEKVPEEAIKLVDTYIMRWKK